MTTIAIIKTGGKQYKVSQGDIIKVEKIDKKEGVKLKLKTLFIGNDKKVIVGQPEINENQVEGEVVKQTKAKKVVGIKHKAKKRQLKKFGHRQPMTEIKIVKLVM